MSIRTSVHYSNAALVTHSGTFHADDVLSTVILSKYLGGTITVERIKNFSEFDERSIQRREAIIKHPVIVYDIGGGKYDHHQEGGNGTRENGIPYSSAGLVWKDFGIKLLSKTFPNNSDWVNNYILNFVDQNLIQGIDAYDNNVLPSLDFPTQPMNFSEIIQNFNPRWDNQSEDSDAAFIQAVSCAEVIFDKLIQTALSKATTQEMVESSINSATNGIMVFDQSIGLEEWEEAFFSSINKKANEIMYAVIPVCKTEYRVWCIPEKQHSKNPRKPFPDLWKNVSILLKDYIGIPDALYCHSSGALAATKSLESAISLANLAMKE